MGRRARRCLFRLTCSHPLVWTSSFLISHPLFYKCGFNTTILLTSFFLCAKRAPPMIVRLAVERPRSRCAGTQGPYVTSMSPDVALRITCRPRGRTPRAGRWPPRARPKSFTLYLVWFQQITPPDCSHHICKEGPSTRRVRVTVERAAQQLRGDLDVARRRAAHFGTRRRRRYI